MSSVRSRRRRPRRRISPLTSNAVRRLRSSSATETEDAIVLDDTTLDESCIDLTSTGDDEFVDLTSSQRSQGSVELVGTNDSSVVIIGSPSDSPPANPRNRRALPSLEVFDDELPPPPFDLPDLTVSPSTSRSTAETLRSPDPIKITCPICLDDDKTIKKDHRKFATTICGHIFCQPCVEGSIRSQNCCPVCRKKLTLRNIVVIHL